MSYVIAGRAIKNEFLALGVLFGTGAIAYASTRGSSGAAKAKANEVKEGNFAPGTFSSSDEEAFIKKFIADAEKEEAGGHKV
ncbi:hypothetical protein BOTBODRAFT_36425 [Botryobasidium botryosum FD-172 SS1]|uniref:ATP synthase subunit K, mitochondrial n=1 Tax=Botryobasidium botryosum (strain FD-172 SS1) TaxID=930990 RepID=A0A067M473_BOTB1|nr:hypothetical protein BOTBODRAFT_36425 [Botryobasidium botryosum FD-172 SS1]